MSAVILVLLVALVLVVVVAAVVVAVVVALSIMARRSGDRGASPAAAPPVPIPIAGLPEGVEVTVAGRVHGLGALVTGPLSGESLVGYVAVLEVLTRASGLSKWRIAHVEKSVPEFLIVDASGEARVAAAGRANLESVSPREESFGGLKSPSDAASAFMTRIGYVRPSSLTAAIHRLREHRLEPGAHVVVSARVGSTKEPATLTTGPRTQAERVVLEAGTQPVRIASGEP